MRGGKTTITNGGGIRGNRTYDPGTAITRRDVLSELPFGNKTLLLEVTGTMIADALENGVSHIENSAGRFPQISGISFAVDAGAEPGTQVSDIKMGGAPLDSGATYKLATNDYMARGGDGYGVFKSAKKLLGDLDAKLMANIREAGEVVPEIEGRIASK